ncbi:hypothetical protein CI109_101925 [Kwoniella shandongensis]|uniref:Uncharacterized protein n=1 Tax=Kwoniella shandongensis TaxID=1734106 RepID=A0A5M6BVL6_9TREE|nr:uncharacterized protein CI109_005415 [Kwoniella shandongensis]KAA5526291.1 hypothetical protein CI109_005415 [Kwoniella shandongensis]
MDSAPLTLNVLSISPQTLIPTTLPPSYSPLPSTPLPVPPPPDGFTFSPTPNYPTPYGALSLGSNVSLRLGLENTHIRQHDVLGVKMMVEIQGPSGRYRLGEVVHSSSTSQPPPTDTRDDDDQAATTLATDAANETLPELKFGESVEIQVESEMKDLGLNVIICSVAWETLDGRRTFQRFLKFNVNPPLAIKTRIQTPSHPNHSLSSLHREDIYLEILMQNVGVEGMILQSVNLESVQGLLSRPIGGQLQKEGQGETLIPNDTRQYLFVLSPDDSPSDKTEIGRSSFPPVYQGGTILPLGRLDVTWIAGPYHTPGRLQTSTLNRRVPLAPVQPPSSTINRPIAGRGAIPPSPLGTPARQQGGGMISPSPRVGGLPSLGLGDEEDDEDEGQKWEFDLMVVGEREVDVEQVFGLQFRLGVRSIQPISPKDTVAENNERDGSTSSSTPPSPPRIAIQYLTPLPPPSAPTPLSTAPTLALSPPSRTTTPLSPAPTSAVSNRPFSPLSPSTSTSRPMTPLSSQLRQAAGSLISSSVPSTPQQGVPPSLLGFGQDIQQEQQRGEVVFPPPPTIVQTSLQKNKPLPSIVTGAGSSRKGDPTSTSTSTSSANQSLHHIGNSLLIPLTSEIKLVPKIVNTGPNYNAEADTQEQEKRWEGTYEFELKFMPWDEGLAALGGMRVLVLNGSGQEDDEVGGSVVREWESLGDVSVVG